MTFQEHELERLALPAAPTASGRHDVDRRSVLRGGALGALGVGAAAAVAIPAAAAATPRPAPRVIGFNSTGVIVKRLERSLHFYVDLVGYTRIGRIAYGRSTVLDRVLDLHHATYRIATVRPPGTPTDGRHRVYTELIEIDGGRRTWEAADPRALYLGRTHTGIWVEDIYDLFDRLKAAGVRSVGERVEVNAAGTLAVAYMLDPDDAIWEILGPPAATAS